MYKIVKAKYGEQKTAMTFINQAKTFLKACGVDQWQNGYPDETCISDDIKLGKGYFICKGDIPAGYMCIDFDGEPAYDELQGNWLNDEKYIVIHRMAMSDSERGNGIAQKAFGLAGEIAVSEGVKNIRVDTDDDNDVMKHILKKSGFTYCGTIWFDNSEKIAFQKEL